MRAVWLEGEAFAGAVVSCEVNGQCGKERTQWHRLGNAQAPGNGPHAIKSNTLYPMEVSVVDVDALAHVVSSTRIHVSLFHDPYSKGRGPEAIYIYHYQRAVVQNADDGCVNLGIYTY